MKVYNPMSVSYTKNQTDEKFVTVDMNDVNQGEPPISIEAKLVPAGGTTGQVLSKSSNENYETEWTTVDDKLIPAGGTTGQILSKNTNSDYDTSWKSFPKFNLILSKIGPIQKGSYNFDTPLDSLVDGDIFIVRVQRESLLWYQNFVMYTANGNINNIMCMANSNTGINMFNSISFSKNQITFNADWYNAFGYSGYLDQSLCTWLQVYKLY